MDTQSCCNVTTAASEMKSMTNWSKPSALKSHAQQLLAIAASLLLVATVVPRAAAQENDTEYEWDPTWGLHEEEWYDPSDWFNDDGKIDTEDVGTFGYDSTYYGGPFWSDYGYYGTYGYDYNDYDAATTGADTYSYWDPTAESWVVVAATTEDDSKKQREEAKKKAGNQKPKQQIDKTDVVTVRGTIADVGRAKAKGSQQEHTYAQLNVAKGKDMLVDFGPKSQIGKMELKKGKKLQVRGPRTKVGGKYILMAQQVSELKGGKGKKDDKKS